MATSPIVQATKKWQKITAQVGENAASAAVQKMDMQRVSSGVTGLSQQEALAAISSAAQGKQAIQKQPSASLTGLPGRFAQDIGSMGMGLGIGLAHLVSHPGRDIKGAIKAVPQTIQQVVHPQQEDLGGELRAIAGSPYGKFIPGSQTAANLTTAAGRHQILEHPGFTAADLLPYASEGLGALAKAGMLGDVNLAGSVAEAAKTGRVSRTALRAIAQGVERLSGGKIAPGASVESVVKSVAATKLSSVATLHFNNFLAGKYALDPAGEQAAVAELVKENPVVKALKPDIGVGFPGEPGYTPNMASDAQKAFQGALRDYGTKPEAILHLPEDQAKVIKGAWRDLRQMQFSSWVHNTLLAGTPTTLDAQRASITLLHPAAVDKYMASYTAVNPFEHEFAKLDPKNLPSEVTQVLPHGVPVMHVMPKDLYNVLYKQDGLWHGLTEQPVQAGKFLTTMKKLTSTYKGALFLRPALALRIGIGSLVQMIGEHDVFTPENIRSAIDHMHNGDIPHMSRGFRGMDGDQAHRFMAGATLGRIAKGMQGYQSKLVDLTTSIQHALVYTKAFDAAAKTGGELAAKMAGEEAISKVFNNWNALTPSERAITQYVFPFYGFQKHIIDYLSRYPAEHPFATKIYAQIAQSETDMHNTGLPQQLQQMFQIGGTDSSGKFLGVNMAGFNPFSRVAGDVSLLSGFATSINPALSAALEAFGVTHQGTPELYPNLTVDPVTGNLVATRPKTTPFTLAEHFLPQLSTIDEILGFNNKLKTMRAQNPSAYKAYLFQQIGVPVPQWIDSKQQIARMSDNLFRVSQQDVSNYLRTGDPGYISGYNELPYQGRWMTPAQLEQLYETASRLPHAKGTAIKDLLPKLRKVRPSAPPQGA